MKKNAGNTRSQSGIGLIGLLLILIVFGLAGSVALKVFPSYLEFYTIQSTIKRIAHDQMLQSDTQKRQSFDHQMHVEMIKDIKGSDLQVSASAMTVQYQKRIPLSDNMTLLIDFTASSE